MFIFDITILKGYYSQVPIVVTTTILLYAYTLDTAENKDVGGVSNVEDAVEINLDECRTH